MKPRIFTAVMMFISAFSPLFLIIAVKDFDFQAQKLTHKVPIIAMLIITGISIVLLFWIFKSFSKGNTIVKISKVSSRSTDLINYTIPYMFSFIGINLGSPADVISVSIFMFILMILTITSKSVFVNPLLSMGGYGLYDVEYSYNGKPFSTIAISDVELFPGDSYHIRGLTQFQSIITGRAE